MKRFQQGAIHILAGFILGILLIQCGLPLLDGITSLLLTMIEALKGYFGTIVTKYNTKISNIVHADDSVKHAIGFSIPDEEEYVDEDEIL